MDELLSLEEQEEFLLRLRAESAAQIKKFGFNMMPGWEHKDILSMLAKVRAELMEAARIAADLRPK